MYSYLCQVTVLEPCMGLVCLYFWAMHNRSWKLVLGHQVDARGTYWLMSRRTRKPVKSTLASAGCVQARFNWKTTRTRSEVGRRHARSSVCRNSTIRPRLPRSVRTHKSSGSLHPWQPALLSPQSHLTSYVGRSRRVSRARKRCRGYPALEDVLTTGIYVLARFEGPSVVPAE